MLNEEGKILVRILALLVVVIVGFHVFENIDDMKSWKSWYVDHEHSVAIVKANSKIEPFENIVYPKGGGDIQIGYGVLDLVLGRPLRVYVNEKYYGRVLFHAQAEIQDYYQEIGEEDDRRIQKMVQAERKAGEKHYKIAKEAIKTSNVYNSNLDFAPPQPPEDNHYEDGGPSLDEVMDYYGPDPCVHDINDGCVDGRRKDVEQALYGNVFVDGRLLGKLYHAFSDNPVGWVSIDSSTDEAFMKVGLVLYNHLSIDEKKSNWNKLVMYCNCTRRDLKGITIEGGDRKYVIIPVRKKLHQLKHEEFSKVMLLMMAKSLKYKMENK